MVFLALEFKTADAQRLEFTMGLPTWGIPTDNYLMVNTIADPDDIKETVQNIVTNAFCTYRGG
jgi:hypothetical protein